MLSDSRSSGSSVCSFVQVVEDTLRSVCQTSGFREIRTPVVESSKLFNHSLGEHSEVILKQMFRLEVSDPNLHTKQQFRPWLKRMPVRKMTRLFFAQRLLLVHFSVCSVSNPAGVVRAVIDAQPKVNGHWLLHATQTRLQATSQLFYVGPMFRHER